MTYSGSGIVTDLEHIDYRHPTGGNFIIAATLNCQGAKYVQLCLEAASKTNITVLALQETRNTTSLDSPDWVTWFSPGDTGHQAGVGIAIRNSLFARQTLTREQIVPFVITSRAIGVTLDLLHIGPISFLSVYVPAADVTSVRVAFISQLMKLTEPLLRHTIVLLGD